MPMTLLKSLQRDLISKFCMLLIISLAFLCSDNADASFKHNRNNSSSWRQHKPRSKHLKIVISAAVNGNGFLDPYLNSITHHSLRRLHPNSPNSSSPKKLKIKLKWTKNGSLVRFKGKIFRIFRIRTLGWQHYGRERAWLIKLRYARFALLKPRALCHRLPRWMVYLWMFSECLLGLCQNLEAQRWGDKIS